MKIVHDQQVQEALERNRIGAERATHGQGLFQAIGQLVAHFTSQPSRKQAAESCNDCPHMQEVEGQCEPTELTATC